ncbi:hypothetical protein KSD_46600 [Ktedonobacter sp. SOSP1-85]|nr:hypothetical protein KSD_46600 [Ktedonobacter sp. SOSP1-85]
MLKNFALKHPAFVGRSVRDVKAEADFYEKTCRHNPANILWKHPCVIESRTGMWCSRHAPD